MKINKGDKVIVIAGKDKGKVSQVLRVFTKKNSLVVEGVNLVKKHIKPNETRKEGGVVSFEKPINASNVMYYSEEEKRAVRLGFKKVDGKKFRMMKDLNKVIDPKSKKAKDSEDADKSTLKKKAEKK